MIFFQFLKSAVPVLMGTFIFLNPFPHTTSIKEICFYLSTAMVFFLIIFKKEKFSVKLPLLLPLILFSVWSLISVFFALDYNNSIHDFYSHLVRYLILYFILTNAFTTKRQFLLLAKIIITSTAIVSLGEIIYYYLIVGNNFPDKLINFSQLPSNRVSMLSACAIIFALHLLFNKDYKTSWKYIVICLLPLFSLLILTQTRGTLLALSLALILLFFRRKKLLFAFLGAILVIISATPIKDRLFSMASNYPRISTNYRTIEILKDYPIFGIGFGMQTYGNHPDVAVGKYMSRIPTEYQGYEFFSVPHNILLSVAVRTGLVGFGLFFYLSSVFCYTCWKLFKSGNDEFVRQWGMCILSAFVLFFVAGLFEPVFNHMSETLLFTLFSMGSILWRLNPETGCSQLPARNSFEQGTS